MRKSANQQKQHQKKEETYNNPGIIAKKPTNTELDIFVCRLVVVVRGKEGECLENTTNMQNGATTWGNIPQEGHGEDYTIQNIDYRDQNSRKSNERIMYKKSGKGATQGQHTYHQQESS